MASIECYSNLECHLAQRRDKALSVHSAETATRPSPSRLFFFDRDAAVHGADGGRDQPAARDPRVPWHQLAPHRRHLRPRVRAPRQCGAQGRRMQCSHTLLDSAAPHAQYARSKHRTRGTAATPRRTRRAPLRTRLAAPPHPTSWVRARAGRVSHFWGRHAWDPPNERSLAASLARQPSGRQPSVSSAPSSRPSPPAPSAPTTAAHVKMAVLPSSVRSSSSRATSP